MATPFSAKNAKVRFGATTVTAKEWSVEYESGEVDTTNFEGAGYSDVIAGIKSVTFTVVMDFDSAQNPYDVTGLEPGDTASTVKLYLNDTTSPYWSFASALCVKSSNSAKVKEGVPITYTFKNKGTFTAPTGNF